LIDRGNRKKAMEAMETTKQALTQKETSIWFFAEGTRNKGKNMLPFKKGAFVTAVNAGVPIIPVCTSSYLDGFGLDQLKNPTARIKVLEPIETKDLALEDIDQLMQDLHAKMMETIKELDAQNK
jgi:1-acyl-sn-glycerol-3-phosphate acyltransferase